MAKEWISTKARHCRGENPFIKIILPSKKWLYKHSGLGSFRAPAVGAIGQFLNNSKP
jgi:hypothetical protein